MNNCKICGNIKNNRVFTAREMLNGTRSKFDYLVCAECDCVQIIEIPQNMTEYYSNASYGSFNSIGGSTIKNLIRSIRNKHAILGRGGLLGEILNRLVPLPADYCVIKDYAAINSKILDVGCGAGAYINDLKNIGFSQVAGIDPFLDRDLEYANGVVIRKKFLEQVTEKYDVVLSHHSFEHVPKPLETLLSIKKILQPGGVCLLTIPVAEDLFRKYQHHCYLIQAPQHFFLYSIKGVSILAKHAGMVVEKIIRDATTTSDWYRYSELWRRDVSSNEIGTNVAQHFSKKELKEFSNIERDLNRLGKGDNVTFILRDAT